MKRLNLLIVALLVTAFSASAQLSAVRKVFDNNHTQRTEIILPKVNGQALYSYKLKFEFTTDAGALEHLNGRTFQVEDVDFVEEYFPGFQIPAAE